MEVEGTHQEKHMVAWCQRGYEKIWFVLGGRTVSEQIAKEIKEASG